MKRIEHMYVYDRYSFESRSSYTEYGKNDKWITDHRHFMIVMEELSLVGWEIIAHINTGAAMNDYIAKRYVPEVVSHE